MSTIDTTEDSTKHDKEHDIPCHACKGSGWVTRDADIGTDQECFVCYGTGIISDDTEESDCSKPSKP